MRLADELLPTDVDFILFGRKRCIACGRDLPRCSDFFPVDRDNEDGLRGKCRGCHNVDNRRRHRESRS